METRRWLNQSQPQTLVIGVFLLYFSGAFAILTAIGLLNGFDFYILATANKLLGTTDATLIMGALGAASVAAGYGIANERKWGYALGVAVAVIPIACRVFASFAYAGVGMLDTDVIGFMFDAARLALLLHPQSREYQRIWFK